MIAHGGDRDSFLLRHLAGHEFNGGTIEVPSVTIKRPRDARPFPHQINSPISFSESISSINSSPSRRGRMEKRRHSDERWLRTDIDPMYAKMLESIGDDEFGNTSKAPNRDGHPVNCRPHFRLGMRKIRLQRRRMRRKLMRCQSHKVPSAFLRILDCIGDVPAKPTTNDGTVIDEAEILPIYCDNREKVINEVHRGKKQVMRHPHCTRILNFKVLQKKWLKYWSKRKKEVESWERTIETGFNDEDDYPTDNRQEEPVYNVIFVSLSNISMRLSRSDFCFGEELGSGGMGTVFNATVNDPSRWDHIFGNQTLVAIKKINKREVDATKLRSEVEIHDVLSNHRNVPTIYAFFQDASTAYLVMELIKGPDLAHYLRVVRNLDEKPALKIVQQVLEVLHTLHDQDCAHMDIKPGNIIFEDSPYDSGNELPPVRVVDFGLSIQFGSPGDVFRKECWERNGTVGYTAPEMDNGSGEYSAAVADIWSVGCLLYGLLTGTLPYDGGSHGSILQQIREDENILSREIVRDVSEATQAFLQMCLSYDPEGRPSAADALDKVKIIMRATILTERPKRFDALGFRRETENFGMATFQMILFWSIYCISLTKTMSLLLYHYRRTK